MEVDQSRMKMMTKLESDISDIPKLSQENRFVSILINLQKNNQNRIVTIVVYAKIISRPEYDSN
jgi:hypothetical protein